MDPQSGQPVDLTAPPPPKPKRTLEIVDPTSGQPVATAPAAAPPTAKFRGIARWGAAISIHFHGRAQLMHRSDFLKIPTSC